MAAPMNFCPGGAEYDDDDFDGFVLGCDDINDYGNSVKVQKSFFQNGHTKNNYAGKSGFGSPVPKSSVKHTEKPTKRSTPSVVGIDDFRMAVMRGNLDVIKEYIKQGYSVNTTLKCGWTPLMYAANSASPQIVQYLLNNGADPHFHKDMYTVLMAACGSTANNEDDILKCVDHLLEKGVNVNTHDRYHMSPLMYAAREGRVKIIGRLLNNKANINKQDSRGWTSLSWAISKNHQAAAKLLVDKGADISKKHCDGQTVMDLAEAQDLPPIIRLLGGNTEELTNENTKFVSGESPTWQKNSVQEKQTVMINSSQQSAVVKYGELELFLCGLDLSHLVPFFQDQRVDFDMFLRLTDDDLLKMGLNQIGVRKKILDGIHAVHKKDWEKTSLPKVQYNKQMSCAEAVAMTANICKHTKYISSTIGYISDHVTSNSSMLESQDGTSPKQIYKHCQDTMSNVDCLQKELEKLTRKLDKVFQKQNVDPSDLVPQSKASKSRINYKRVLCALFVTVPIFVVVLKKDSLVSKITEYVT